MGVLGQGDHDGGMFFG